MLLDDLLEKLQQYKQMFPHRGVEIRGELIVNAGHPHPEITLPIHVSDKERERE